MTGKRSARRHRLVIFLLCLCAAVGLVAGGSHSGVQPGRPGTETRLLAWWQRLQAQSQRNQDWLGQAWARLIHHDRLHDRLLNARLDIDEARIDRLTLHEAVRACAALYRAGKQLALAHGITGPGAIASPLDALSRRLHLLCRRQCHRRHRLVHTRPVHAEAVQAAHGATPAASLAREYRALLGRLDHLLTLLPPNA